MSIKFWCLNNSPHQATIFGTTTLAPSQVIPLLHSQCLSKAKALLLVPSAGYMWIWLHFAHFALFAIFPWILIKVSDTLLTAVPPAEQKHPWSESLSDSNQHLTGWCCRVHGDALLLLQAGGGGVPVLDQAVQGQRGVPSLRPRPPPALQGLQHQGGQSRMVREQLVAPSDYHSLIHSGPMFLWEVMSFSTKVPVPFNTT